MNKKLHAKIAVTLAMLVVIPPVTADSCSSLITSIAARLDNPDMMPATISDDQIERAHQLWLEGGLTCDPSNIDGSTSAGGAQLIEAMDMLSE